MGSYLLEALVEAYITTIHSHIVAHERDAIAALHIHSSVISEAERSYRYSKCCLQTIFNKGKSYGHQSSGSNLTLLPHRQQTENVHMLITHTCNLHH